MANKPVKTYSYGQIQMSIWEGEYEGKKTYSFKFQKNYKTKNNEWKQTDFFNDKELMQIQKIIDEVCSKKVKVRETGSSNQQTKPQPPKDPFDNISFDESENVPF